MDLIVRRVQLADRAPGDLIDIGVSTGRIVAMEPNLLADAQLYDAAGRLGCAGLIETHIHLDKSRLLARCPAEVGRAISPVPYVARFKSEISEEDAYSRAEKTLRECLLNGTTHMRTQVEVDPKIGLRGYNAVARLAKEYASAIDIEICVFPQDGLTNVPGEEELLVEVLRRGVHVIGGAPRYDHDGPAQIRRIFELAREYDCEIDIHLDVGPTTDDLLVPLVAELTEKYRIGGRVTVGHMAKLSLLPPEAVASIAHRLAEVGVSVTVLPATDLYLMGRNRDYAVPRGVADAHFLVHYGVNCSLSSNNILNPATPFGDCSLIRIANLQANLLQVSQPADLRECFNMITSRSARLMNLKNYGLAIGNPADIVIIDSTSPEATIAELRRPITVFKGGRQTVICEPGRVLV